MLEIVLWILKIAGIIIVSILGILIVLICFVLVVPARYRGDFSVSGGENGEKKTVNVALKATWLLHLVRVYVTCEKAVRVRIKILFFTFMDTGREKRRGKKKGKRRTGGTERAPEGREESGTKETPEKSAECEPPKAPAESAEGSPQETPPPEADGEGAPEVGADATEKKSFNSLISNILQTIRNFCDKLKEIKEKAEKIETLWLSDHMVKSRSLLGRQLTYLLKHTRPRHLSGFIRFGFEDPSATGYAMALYGILYPIWSPKLDLEPDFEKQLLECHILIKGKIRVWHFARVALRMLLSRDVRRVIGDVRKL